MVMTMLLCVVVYVLFGLAATGIDVMDQAQQHDPDTALALAFKALGINWITQVIYVAALFGAAAASLTN
jgi:amino acid transporter